MPPMDQPLPFDSEEPTGRSPRVRQRLRSAHERRARRRRLISYGLLAASFVLMVDALVGENGYLATIRAQHEYEQVSTELYQVEADINAMKREVQRLRNDPSALEEAARRELGLIRPGETLIIIKPVRPSGPAPRGR
ncbi:MAG: septum formation initiator family protein [Vicinamibacterales bacterium]